MLLYRVIRENSFWRSYSLFVLKIFSSLFKKTNMHHIKTLFHYFFLILVNLFNKHNDFAQNNLFCLFPQVFNVYHITFSEYFILDEKEVGSFSYIRIIVIHYNISIKISNFSINTGKFSENRYKSVLLNKDAGHYTLLSWLFPVSYVRKIPITNNKTI